MTEPVVIIEKSIGLNNRLDPVELAVGDPRATAQNLAVVYNFICTDTGRLIRRKGIESMASGAYHSIYHTSQGYSLAVIGSTMVAFADGYAPLSVRTVTAGARVSYVDHWYGPHKACFYANGHQTGIVIRRASYVWTMPDYVGPTTTRGYKSAPVGHLLARHNGRIFVAVDNVVFYSQFGGSRFEWAEQYLSFESRITAMHSLKGGMFFSTDKAVYWRADVASIPLDETVVSDYPIIEGTNISVPGSKLLDGQFSGLQVMVAATKEGICFGAPGGVFRNITEDRVTYPSAKYGAVCVVDGKYILQLSP